MNTDGRVWWSSCLFLSDGVSPCCAAEETGLACEHGHQQQPVSRPRCEVKSAITVSNKIHLSKSKYGLTNQCRVIPVSEWKRQSLHLRLSLQPRSVSSGWVLICTYMEEDSWETSVIEELFYIF